MIKPEENKLDKSVIETIGILKSCKTPAWHDEWSTYSELDVSKELIGNLMELMKLDAEYELEGEEGYWSGVHAWRILSQKQIQEALPLMIERLIMCQEDDDFGYEDLPKAIANLGANALPLLLKTLSEDTIVPEEVWGFLGILEASMIIAKEFPSEKNSICEGFRNKLKKPELNPPLMNAFICSDLAQLKDLEAIPLIVEAFSHGFVDTNAVTWKEILEDMGDVEGLPSLVMFENKLLGQASYSGDESFNILLKTIGSRYHIDELKFFLLGSILAIDMVPPAAIIDAVLTDLEGFEVELESEGQSAYFTSGLYGLWNSLTKYQDLNYPLPSRSDVNEEELKNTATSFSLLRCIGCFLEGLELGSTTTNTLSGSAAEFLTNLKKIYNQIDELFIRSLDDKSLDLQPIITLANDFWNAHYLDFAKAARDARIKKSETRIFLAEHKNIGRNDPCPCKSGKKFKKCCLN